MGVREKKVLNMRMKEVNKMMKKSKKMDNKRKKLIIMLNILAWLVGVTAMGVLIYAILKNILL